MAHIYWVDYSNKRCIRGDKKIMKNYTVFHLHSDQSLLDSRTNYKDYVNKAKELGQTALAFTEHGRLNWWVKKKMYCEENGIKYIHGIEVYLTEDKDAKVRDNYHTVLLAKNYEGVKEINTLYSKSWNKEDGHFYAKPRITFDEFFSLSNNVIKTSACLQSPILAFKDGELADKLLRAYDYYEIQPHNVIRQHDFNEYLYEMSQKYNKPLILGTDTHNLDQYKADCREIIQLAKGWTVKDEGMSDEEVTFDLTYHSYDELVDIMKRDSHLPDKVWLDAIENTNVMAESCEEWELDLSFKYPILYGEKDEEKLWEKLRTDYVKKLEQGAIKEENAEKYGEAVKEEMRVFKKINMLGFMLGMSELVDWCWENDIPVGYSRGSVAGSVVAYLSNITDVDPIIWGTMFSRFANEDRVEIGDIDIDISPDQRDMVFSYIIGRFGTDNTAKILACTTMGEKGAIDDIGRGLKNKWNKEHKEEFKNGILTEADNPWSLDVIDNIKNLYAKDPDEARREYSELFYYFDGCVGTVVAESSHPAGIVASPITLPDNYGVFIDKNGVITLPLDMDEVHEAGLVKYDILGLNNVQIIRDTCKYAGLPYPKAHLMNWEDEKVWDDMITSPVGIDKMLCTL